MMSRDIVNVCERSLSNKIFLIVSFTFWFILANGLLFNILFYFILVIVYTNSTQKRATIDPATRMSFRWPQTLVPKIKRQSTIFW